MNEKIRAIIIDDEETFISSLSILLNANFPEVKIIDKCETVASGVLSIKKHKPDIVFLDINLPDGTGFDLLEKITNRNFEIIFTTSHSEYAVRAFEFSALHYLTKPIDLPKLKSAIGRFNKIQNNESLDEKLGILKQSLLDRPQKILLPSSNGLLVHNLGEIVRFEADNNYTKVVFNTGKTTIVSKPLQNFCLMLEDLEFCRVHNSHLVNLRYVARFHNTRHAKITLSDGFEMPISQSQKAIFIEKLKSYAMSF